MGSFSWMKADDLTDIANVVYGKPFKMMIPKEFGGGIIKDDYQDYGYIGYKEDGSPKHDMYELLALWNAPEKCKFDGEFNPLKEIDKYTQDNREIGIDIGCYNEDIDKLRFPLKLVSRGYRGTYEDLAKPSYNDPYQGFTIIRRNSRYFQRELNNPREVDDYE